MKQSIKRASDSFILRDHDGSKSIRMSEVIAVYGVKVDKITYEENFLVLMIVDGRKIAVGELADGFFEFVATITTSLNNFPGDWSVSIDRTQVGDEILLWARA